MSESSLTPHPTQNAYRSFRRRTAYLNYQGSEFIDSEHKKYIQIGVEPQTVRVIPGTLGTAATEDTADIIISTHTVTRTAGDFNIVQG